MSYYWLNSDSRQFLERGYLKKGQSAEQRIRHIAETAEAELVIPGFANKFEDYMSRGWISLSSPVWSNYGNPNGLPISCNNSYFEDSVASILAKTSEIGMQTKYGAGTSAYLGELRGRGTGISGGGTSNGPVHFMEMIQTTTNVISQSTVRRGSCAVYLPIDHPDIELFLECREEGHLIQHLSLGVCVPDDFMRRMINGDVDARRVWMRVLKKRFETGYPYIFFTDTVNRNAPQVYRDKGMKIHSSNLCSEICQPSSADESFVCDLASVNLLHFHDWEHTDLIETMVYLLDAILSEYIDKTENKPMMRTAYNFAKNHRAIGLGVLGWHSYLQSQMIPFESMQAKFANVHISKTIDEHSQNASRKMALDYGKPVLMQNYDMRHATRLAIAPTTSSSFILGQISPSIEPLDSNYFIKDLQKGKFTYKNPYLVQVLDDHKKDDHDTWRSILMRGGSVQHLDFLTDNERDVFKTFGEISQMEIIIQAAQRQKYIDQTQSLNLKIHPSTPLRDVNKLMITAWELGVKTLYYQRSTNPAQEYVRELMTCSACEA